MFLAYIYIHICKIESGIAILTKCLTKQNAKSILTRVAISFTVAKTHRMPLVAGHFPQKSH